MTREEAVERLCTIYQSQFDINRCSAEQTPLAVTMDFYALSDKYVLSKKAKLWEAKSFEYVYVFSVPHLTREIYESCEKMAYEHGMARIQPGPTHMYTYITTLFVCDSCDEDARQALTALAARWAREDAQDRRVAGALALSAAGLLVILLI